MSMIGNIFWMLFGGLYGALCWFLAGIVMYITIIGIPLGHQCFKFARLALFPFGKVVVYGQGEVSFLLNLIWIVLCGWELALSYVALGAGWCVTVVGIPVGMQCFKLAKLSLMPFGASVVDEDDLEEGTISTA